MTVLNLTGFEHQTLPGFGAAWYNTSGGSPAIDTSLKRTGTASAQFNPSAAVGYVEMTINPSDLTVEVARVYFNFTTLPGSGIAEIMSIYDAALGHHYKVYYDATLGNLAARIGAGTVVEGPEIVTGTWYLLDMKATQDGATQRLDWQIDEDAQTQATLTASGRPQMVDLGPITATTCTLNVDDFVATDSAADYPIGPGYVLALKPNGMGTHVNPTHFQEDDGTAIVSTSWDRLDDWPPNVPASWDGIKQVTLDGTSYIELTMENTAETAPIQGVLAALAHHITSGSARNRLKVYVDGAEEGVYVGSVSSTSLAYHGAVLTSVATWDSDILNAALVRVGYGDDVSPNPLMDAVIFEVAYLEPPDSIGSGTPSGVELATFTHSLVPR